MRVGINLLYLIPEVVGGTETYAAGLLHGLSQIDTDDEFVVLMNRESSDWPLPKASNFTRVICPIRAASRVRRYLFEQLQLPRLLRKHRLDILHSLGYASPLFPPCPSVVTIPDLNYRAFGDQMPAHKRLTLQLFVSQSALRAKRVITISEYSRLAILAEFSLPSTKVVVTHLAPKISPSNCSSTEQNPCSKLGIRSPYIMAFSSQSPNKNIPRLIEAFTALSERHKLPHQLVLVGHKPSAEQLGRFDGRHTSDAILFTGYLPDHLLANILSGAQALVFPSLYEGFGLPVLEAMAAGVPVICSNQSSLPEVAGEAALFFDPFSTEDMAQKIAQVALDHEQRAQLRRKGLENVQRFSWEKTALDTLEVYQHLHTGRYCNSLS